MLIKKKEQK
jgi:intraflagellar transport protein 81